MQIPRWNLVATRDLHVPYDANTCSKRLLTPRSFRYDCVCRSVHVIDTSNRSLATSRNLPTWLQWMIASCKTHSLPVYIYICLCATLVGFRWLNSCDLIFCENEKEFFDEYQLLSLIIEVSAIYLNFYDYNNSHSMFLFILITFLIHQRKNTRYSSKEKFSRS